MHPNKLANQDSTGGQSLRPSDKRGGKLAVVAHCILNQNSRVLGLAHYPATIREVVDVARQLDIGFVQLPCPELVFAGSQRPPKTREEYDTPSYRKHCKKIAVSMVSQLAELARNGVALRLVLGVKKSPSCDVGEASQERGILMEALKTELERNRLRMPMHSINASGHGLDMERLETLLREP
jgi:predicted secreted protein